MHSMDSMRTAHGLYVDCRKYSHGLLMDCSWTAHSAHGVLMESMSTRCGLHTSAHGLHGNVWGSVKYSIIDGINFYKH